MTWMGKISIIRKTVGRYGVANPVRRGRAQRSATAGEGIPLPNFPKEDGYEKDYFR